MEELKNAEPLCFTYYPGDTALLRPAGTGSLRRSIQGHRVAEIS